jgi:NitT/TauT family transport system permease protein
MAETQSSTSRWHGLRTVVRGQQRNLLRLTSILVAIGAWWVLSLFYPPALIPGPKLVFEETYNVILYQNFGFHMGQTMIRVLASFIISMVVSTALGIMMGSNENAEAFFETYILVGLTVPSLAIAMIMLLLFGIGNVAAIAAIVLTMIPIITENMWQGTKDLNQELTRMGRAFEADRISLIKDVVLPQLVPYILAASRFGLSISWKVTVIVEYLGLGNGIGYQIRQAFGLFSFVGVLAWTLSFVFVMVILEFGVLKVIEERLTRWQSSVEGGELRMR